MWLYVASGSVRLYARRAPHELDRAAHDKLVAGGEVVGAVVVERHLPYLASGASDEYSPSRTSHISGTSRVYLGYISAN